MDTFASTTWTDEKKTAVRLKKLDGTELVFRQGDFVTFKGREDGVKIIEIRYRTNDPGPAGFEYLPWRVDEQRWATRIITFSRQPRFVVCYPSGITTCGQHINWESFDLIDGGTCPPSNFSTL